MDKRVQIESLVSRSYALRRSLGVNIQPSTSYAAFVAASRCAVSPLDGSLADSTLRHLTAIYLNFVLSQYRKTVVRTNEWNLDPQTDSGFIQMGNTFDTDFGYLNKDAEAGHRRWFTRDHNDTGESLLPCMAADAVTISYSPDGILLCGAFQQGNVLDLAGFTGIIVCSRVSRYLMTNAQGALQLAQSDRIDHLNLVTAPNHNPIPLESWEMYAVDGHARIEALAVTTGAYRIRLYPRSIVEAQSSTIPNGEPSEVPFFLREEDMVPAIRDLWMQFSGRFVNFVIEASENDIHRLNKLLRAVNSIYGEHR